MRYINLNKGLILILNKKGDITVSAVLMISALMMFLLLTVGIVVTLVPKYEINNEVNTLSKIIEKKGGLPNEDIKLFTKRITESQRYLIGQEEGIVISAYTENGKENCLNTADIDEEGFFIDSTVNDVIVLEVIVPSNNKLLNGVSTVFGSGKVSDQYQYIRHIVSNRAK